jgi:hypothetical protein
MFRFIRYYGQFQELRGNVGGLPSWGKFLVALAAVPGVVLALLCLAGLGVSILALFLLTVPVYRLVQAVSSLGPRRPVEGELMDEDVVIEEPGDVFGAGGRKQVQGTVVE